MTPFELVSPDGEDIHLYTHTPTQTVRSGNGAGLFLPAPSFVLQADCSFGHMHFSCYAGSGFSIWFSRYAIDRPARIIGRADIPILELSCIYEHPFSIDWRDVVQGRLPAKQIELFYAPFVENLASFDARRQYLTLDVHFDTTLLEPYATRFPLLGRFLEKVHRGEPAKLFPAGVKLDPVQGKMSIIANASPDAGFGVLKSFLKATTRELVIAMYDFTSGEILAEVISAITPPSVKFQMVLDHPPRNPTANQTDQDTFDQIMDLKRDNVAINWALTRNDPAATEWIYPSAYHIKVAVRDGNTVWLSSGNFNVSNQPDLAVDDPKKGSLKNADRDWHLVIENGQLAALFRAYILNDFTAAKPYQSKGDPALHKKIDASLKKLKTEKDKSTFIAQKAVQSGAVTMIKAEPFNNLDIKVQPLLTPDPGQHTTMYVDQILALINSAEKSLYMQTQYVHPSEADADKDFQALILAFSAAHKKGLDVRLITSQYENTGQWMEKLKQYDLDQVLRIQDRVHNKGIVVDSSIVVVSSQNWSSAGVLRNRDAGLIVYNTDIASYFEKLFLSDWVNYAKEKVVDASHTRDKKTVKKRPAKRTPSKKTAKKKAAKKR